MKISFRLTFTKSSLVRDQTVIKLKKKKYNLWLNPNEQRSFRILIKIFLFIKDKTTGLCIHTMLCIILMLCFIYS